MISTFTKSFFYIFIATTLLSGILLNSNAYSNAAPVRKDYQVKPVLDTVPSIKSAVNDTSKETAREAYFPGGAQGWSAFLIKNLDTQIPIKKGAPDSSYVVYIQYVVNKDGTLSDFVPLTHHGYGMEEEVIRVLKKSPPWIPAFEHGHIVKENKRQPVTFNIISEKKKRKKIS